MHCASINCIGNTHDRGKGGDRQIMDANQLLNVGIAGYGVVGKRRHAFIDQHPRLKTIAVCDRYFDGSGVLGSGVRFYRNYKELIEEPLNILFVCLPNYMATEVTIAGLERRMHVFCEKPPGCVVGDVERVIKAEEQNACFYRWVAC